MMVLQMLPRVVSSRGSVAARVVGTNTGVLHRPAASQCQQMTGCFALVNRDDPNPGDRRDGQTGQRGRKAAIGKTSQRPGRERTDRLSTRLVHQHGQVSSCCNNPPQQPTVRFRRMQAKGAVIIIN
jgi:hypothetical protein